MKRNNNLILLIIFCLFFTALYAVEYEWYIQSFPWIGEEGEDPEVVFADLIEQDKLEVIKCMECQFWFNGYEWINDIGKIRNDCEYKIKIRKNIIPVKKITKTSPRHNLGRNTIYVDINGTGDYTTIQEGINAAINGDTVLVYPGTYFENINYNGKNITVASFYLITQNSSYIHSTIIDGNQNGSVVTFESGEDSTAVLFGFTIQNGNGIYDLHNIRGGGIFSKNADPKISSCIIKNNNAEIGAGIHCRYSTITLENTTICHNHSFLVGGGIYLRDNSTAHFNSENWCNIYYNHAGRGCDIGTYQVVQLNVIVDTFTVMNPDSYFVLSQPENNFTFDILNAKIEPVNQDLYVSPDGDNNNSGLTQDEPLQTISFALTKIASDSTHPNNIYLGNGIYSPSLTDEKFSLNCRNYVSIIGDDEYNTILDAENLSNIIYVYNDNHFYVENFTIQNGMTRNGGGIKFSNNSSPTIRNVTIKSNSASLGGAILCSDNSSPVFEYVTIKDNYAEFTGGAIYLSYSSPILKNVIISGNSVDPSVGSVPGICAASHSNPLLIDVKIVNNIAGEDHTILGFGNNSYAVFTNITIAGNTNLNQAIDCNNNNNLYLTNCILYNTEANNEINFYSNGFSNIVTISYTDIKDGEDGIQTNGAGIVNWLEGNIYEDPMFVDTLNNNYQLLQGSPCIDAGNPDTTGLNLPELDLAGNPRIYNGIVDMGAYEWQGDTTGVYEPDTSFINNIYLFHNKPNPFRESTTITFISADYERIKYYKLSIYNVKGQLIRTYNGKKDNFRVKTDIVWDGKDEEGKIVSPGVYYYKLEYGNNAFVRKMILLK